MRIKGSYLLAAVLAAALGYWMYSGEVVIGGQSGDGDAAQPIAEREAERTAEVFKVRYVPLQAEARSDTIIIRGRTRADAIIPIRAETGGILEQRLVDKGDRINAGDLVCVIERGAREADLARAEAQLAQAQTEYDANLTLKEKGFAAENRLTALKASVDAAAASVAAARLELSRTEVRAAVSGVVQDPIAEVGDMLQMGGTCVTVVDSDPMLFTGQISEREIGRVSPGMTAEVELITGDTVEGKVRYIAPSADAATRTFATEIELAKGNDVRDGMTAEARIKLDAGMAFRVAPSWVTLGDEGTIGVRIVNTDNIVEFVPVRILAQQQDAFWITGPEDGDRIITLGQEYVRAGETVESEPDTRFGERLAANQ